MGVERKRKHVCARIARNKKNAYQTTTADDQVGTRTIQHPLLHTLSAEVALFKRKEETITEGFLGKSIGFLETHCSRNPFHHPLLQHGKKLRKSHGWQVADSAGAGLFIPSRSSTLILAAPARKISPNKMA